jgi:hypothetical protein
VKFVRGVSKVNDDEVLPSSPSYFSVQHTSSFFRYLFSFLNSTIQRLKKGSTTSISADEVEILNSAFMVSSFKRVFYLVFGLFGLCLRRKDSFPVLLKFDVIKFFVSILEELVDDKYTVVSRPRSNRFYESFFKFLSTFYPDLASLSPSIRSSDALLFVSFFLTVLCSIFNLITSECKEIDTLSAFTKDSLKKQEKAELSKKYDDTNGFLKFIKNVFRYSTQNQIKIVCACIIAQTLKVTKTCDDVKNDVIRYLGTVNSSISSSSLSNAEFKKNIMNFCPILDIEIFTFPSDVQASLKK